MTEASTDSARRDCVSRVIFWSIIVLGGTGIAFVVAKRPVIQYAKTRPKSDW